MKTIHYKILCLTDLIDLYSLLCLNNFNVWSIQNNISWYKSKPKTKQQKSASEFHTIISSPTTVVLKVWSLDK